MAIIPICRKCKYRDYYDDSCDNGDYNFRVDVCRKFKSLATMNFVTGDQSFRHKYEKCSEHNQNGDCEFFKSKPFWRFWR